MEAINRYLQGDYVNVDTANNLTPYTTLGGRRFTGGRDHARCFYGEDTTGINYYYNSVVSRRLDEEYAMLYSDRHRDKLSGYANWQELHSYLLQQPLLLNLVSYADHHGIRRRPFYIQESSELLENVMTAYIVRNFFGEEAFWEAYQREDPLIRKGIELIETGKTTRAAIVSEAYLFD